MSNVIHVDFRSGTVETAEEREARLAPLRAALVELGVMPPAAPSETELQKKMRRAKELDAQRQGKR